jgi:hypothetical protein
LQSCFATVIECQSMLVLFQLFTFRGIKQAETRLIAFTNHIALCWINSAIAI